MSTDGHSEATPIGAGDDPFRDESPPLDGLHSVLVRYECGPDRRTLYPPNVTDDERLTHWISANDSAYRRLDELC